MRVVVADDSVLFREGLVRVLADQGFDVVAQTDNAEDLVRRVGGHKPDAAIVDIRMPPTHTDEGLRAAVEIRRRAPGAKILVLSQYVEVTYAGDLFADRVGGVGYLLKDRVVDVDELTDALRRVAAGGTVLDPQVVSELFAARRDPLATLTPREREVLGLMAQGCTNTAICRRLMVSEGAVEKHIGNIFGKLGLPPSDSDHRRVMAVLTYLRL
jgi:DNA-binding NarL/FixJ family response regulator